MIEQCPKSRAFLALGSSTLDGVSEGRGRIDRAVGRVQCGNRTLGKRGNHPLSKILPRSRLDESRESRTDPNARDASDLASVGRMHHGTHASKPSLAHGRFKQGKERSQAPQGLTEMLTATSARERGRGRWESSQNREQRAFRRLEMRVLILPRRFAFSLLSLFAGLSPNPCCLASPPPPCPPHHHHPLLHRSRSRRRRRRRRRECRGAGAFFIASPPAHPTTVTCGTPAMAHLSFPYKLVPWHSLIHRTHHLLLHL